MPTKDELWKYQVRVAEKYNLIEKTRFHSNIERCEWFEESGRWRITVRDLKTDTISYHECQFLYSGMGILVHPRDIDIPGSESFKGPIFHSARWRHDVDLTNKRVIVIGNGCTGNQIVPSIVDKAKHVTHLVRSKHWILPPIDSQIPSFMRLLAKVPGVMQLQRFIIFAVLEDTLRGFPMTPRGQRYRDGVRALTEKYMRSTAPKKYHDMLIPDYEVGCKRRIFDLGYLECLNRSDVTLTDEKALEIVPEGIRTESGLIEADVIVLANGFKSGRFFGDVDIIGRGGENMDQHWESFGGPEAYNYTVMSGFPNFFVIGGMS